MGKRVEMANSLKIGYDGSGMSGPVDLNTTLEINQNTNNCNGLKFKTYNNGVKLISIENASSQASASPFTVYGAGNTVINCGFPSLKYFTINDASGTATPKESLTIQGDGRTDLNAVVKTNKYFVVNDVSGASKETFAVYGDGKTRIGEGRPKVGGIAANAMLSVDGLILAKEVRVAVSTATHWADYVFDKNYKLRPLAEVETYIKQHNHLPDVPSASEVTQNGVDMLDMNATLLRKIEELTLYTIELKKQLDAQQKEINVIKH